MSDSTPNLTPSSPAPPQIAVSPAPSITPNLDFAFSCLQTYQTEYQRAAARGAHMLLDDWQAFVTKGKLPPETRAPFTDCVAGNLAVLCFPLVPYPEEMEAIAYVLEYCLRQNTLPAASHLAMNATIEALAKGEFCGRDNRRITHMRGIHRVQLIVADRASLTRPMHNRAQTFVERDQALALADMSPGVEVRPDRVLRNVMRLFRLRTAMPNSQAWQECWEGCVRSLTLTGNVLMAGNGGEKSRRDGVGVWKKLRSKLSNLSLSRSSSRSSGKDLLAGPGSSEKETLIKDLENTNESFAAARLKLRQGDESARALVLLDKWEAMVKGHYLWGKESTAYKAWTGPPEEVPEATPKTPQGRNKRSSLMPSLSAGSMIPKLPSPVDLGFPDAQTLKRRSKAAGNLLNDEF